MLRSRAILEAPLILVTGAEGFVGHWLLLHLKELGWRTVGTHKPGIPVPAAALDGTSWVEIDLREAAELAALVRKTQPDYVAHLAAMAVPREAAASPIAALRMNYGVVDILLRAIAAHAPRARVLHVGTGEAYGLRPAHSPPVTEDEPLRPPSPYSATKAAAEVRALQAVSSDGLDVVCVRPLNHSGPGRPRQYVESAFASQIVRIERGEQEPVVRVGNLDGVRDFSDVRDVVRAYALLLEHGERGGVYNVCSGRGWRIRDVLEHLLSRSEVEPRVEVDPQLYQPTDPERCTLIGSPARLEALGWRARYRFEETLDALLEDWRTRS